jgi:hypothetical protein
MCEAGVLGLATHSGCCVVWCQDPPYRKVWSLHNAGAVAVAGSHCAVIWPRPDTP